MSVQADELFQCVQQAKSLFCFFKDDELSDIHRYFSLRKAVAGEAVWHEGDACDYMTFIVSGLLEVKKETEFKGRHITLAIYGAGSIAGELCMLDHQPRAVTATAIEEMRLLLLSIDMFDLLLEEHPLLGIKLLKGILLSTSTRLRKSFDRLIAIF